MSTLTEVDKLLQPIEEACKTAFERFQLREEDGHFEIIRVEPETGKVIGACLCGADKAAAERRLRNARRDVAMLYLAGQQVGFSRIGLMQQCEKILNNLDS